jgi:hypothetical protein
VVVVGHGEPLALDLLVHHAMLALRNPLADPDGALASLGDWQVLCRRCWPAWATWLAAALDGAAHWLAALAFGLALTRCSAPPWTWCARPASSGFGFPSVR